MERVPITSDLPNYRNKLQPYLSELIWIMITFLVYISQINWERKIEPNFFKYSPKVGINLGTGIFFRPDSLFSSFPNLSFIKGVFRQREVNESNQHNWSEPNDRERWPNLKFLILTGWVTSGQRATACQSPDSSFLFFFPLTSCRLPPDWKRNESENRRSEAETG